jgi:hypothetical protein
MLNRFTKGLKNPVEATRYLFDMMQGKIRYTVSGDRVKPNSEKILNKDWDILIILDACRADVFEDVNQFSEETNLYISQAPNTRVWFQRNFVDVDDSKLSDVVYISGNPNASGIHIDKSLFSHFEEVFEYGWDDELRTTPPDVMTERALQIYNEYSPTEDRFVIHFLQPHGPLIGSDSPDLSKNRFEQLRKGNVGKEEVISAYSTCLNYVLSYTEELCAHLDGEIVVSADHGEGFGESGVYAHPPWANCKQTLQVPWLTVEGGGENIPEQKLSMEITDYGVNNNGSTVYEKLEALGYK